MYNNYNPYPGPYCANIPMYNPYYRYGGYPIHPYPCWFNMPAHYPNYPRQFVPLKDYGPNPFVVNIEEAAKQNDFFRIALWTGNHFQLTLMSIRVGEDIGLEMHPNVDQFIRIEEGQGLVLMGNKKDHFDFQRAVSDGYAIIIPAGKWHNVINTGCTPLKLYSIYAPPEHPQGTVHKTKENAEETHE